MRLKPMAAACTAAVLFYGTYHIALAAPGDSWTFSNCSVEGRLGPAQGDCDAEYSGTSLDGAVTVVGGVQAWVVPESGSYRVEALGAAGGTQTFGGTYSAGGMGASIAGTVDLTAGETIYFLVGQKGGDTGASLDNAAPGGGGGTFVYRSAADLAPIIAAGGGGSGSSCDTIVAANQGASSTENGNDSGSDPNGGSGGNGGTTNFEGPDDDSYWAGSGAGWLTDGTGGNNPTNYDFTPGEDGAEGGRSPENGGAGGLMYNDNNPDEGGDGGFGGGGGGGSDNMGGGGGGGYSGGGGANYQDCGATENQPGGGGGSYNSGADPVNTAAANAGHGQVVVSQLTASAGGGSVAVPALGIWGIGILSGLIGLLGMYHRRRAE